MKKYIILFFAVYLWGINVFPQENYKLEMTGSGKPFIEFNEKSIELVITAKAFPEDKKIGISMQIKNNDNKYKFYLFSDNINTSEIEGSNIGYLKLFTWSQKLTKVKIKGNSAARSYNFNFDGNFVIYDKQLLRRTDWKTDGYAFYSTSKNDFDSYSIISENVNQNSNIAITYIFLITEASNEQLLGITNPIKYNLPKSLLDEIFNRPKVEIEKPVANVVEQSDKRVNSLLDLFIRINDVNSYKELNQNPDLKRIYDSDGYNQKIINEIAQINENLAGDKYKADRERLLAKLQRFVQVDEPASELANKELKTEVIPENKQPLQEVKQEKKEIKPAKKESTDPCADLQKRFQNLNSSVNDLRNNIIYSERLINKGLIGLQSKLETCSEEECFNEVRVEFERNNWLTNIEDYENKLNGLARNYNSLVQDDNFKKCNIQSGGFEKLLGDLKQRIKDIQGELFSFQRIIESKFLDDFTFNETIKKFGKEVEIISNRYNLFEKLYRKYDDKLFNSGKLNKAEIKNLDNALVAIDSISVAIDSIILKAQGFYQLNTGQENFPEATFKDQTNFTVNNNDCDNLKKKIEGLVTRAKEVSPGEIGKFIIIGLVGLILLVSAYYYMSIIRKKVFSKNKVGSSQPKFDANGKLLNSMADIDGKEADGFEIIEDGDEKMKGMGLDTIRKLSGISYYEVDVISFIRDTTVRKVYFSRDFIINAYRYFEDSMLNIGNGSIDDLYEYGGFIIGNWDYSPYDKNQYELSLENFIEPGDDAKFSKFNIDFGYSISFRMDEMIMDLANRGNEQVFVGWLHSHPGHNVFLSNYDIEVQERFRNQYHPNRHIALVLEPTTYRWELGLFTFKQSGIMNNKEDIGSFLSFHELYSWAIGEGQSKLSKDHLKFNFSDSKSASFDRSLILQLKIFIERELQSQNSEQVFLNLFGVKSNTEQTGYNIHLTNMERPEVNYVSKLDLIGIFAVTKEMDSKFEALIEEYMELSQINNLSIILCYSTYKSVFVLIPLKPNGKLEKEDLRIEFSKKDILPFLSK